MKSTLIIWLCFVFALQGHATACVDYLCNYASAHNCCAEIAQTDGCCSTQTSDQTNSCSSECAIEAHHHDSVFVFENSSPKLTVTQSLLATVNHARSAAVKQSSQITPSDTGPPPILHTRMHCVWRL